MTWMRIWRRAAVSILAVTGMMLTLPLAAPSAASARTSVRAAVILLDINASMPATGIAAERHAVLAYARALPADVRVGLITFGDGWQMALWPTTSRSRLRAAVTASKASGATSMGIVGALSHATSVMHALDASAGRLVVLSNGEMLIGPAPIAALPADVVIWHFERDDHIGLLRTLASASGGRIASPANAAALATAFPPAPGAHPPASAPAPSPAVAARHAGGVSWGLIAALAAVFAALLLVGLIGVSSLYQQDRHRALADQIGRYGPRHAPAQAGEEGRVASTVIGLTGQLLRSSNSERGLTQRLDLAGISRTPAEWVVLGGSGCVVLAVVLTLLTGNVLVGVLVGAVAGWLAMRLVLNIRTGRRRGAFGEQLPDLLQLIAASLQSGFSLPQALDGVVQENTQPAAGEFSRALTEARIGADLEDALDGVANRMNSDDLRWTVMAIRIQRQVGGNLAEVLQNTVGTMRERAYLRRQVRALSAEARLSAYILSVLPPLVGCWLLFIDPTYMRPLYTTLAGLLLLAVTVVLYVVGVLWMRKVIRVVV